MLLSVMETNRETVILPYGNAVTRRKDFLQLISCNRKQMYKAVFQTSLRVAILAFFLRSEGKSLIFSCRFLGRKN